MRDEDLEQQEENLRQKASKLSAENRAAYHRRFGKAYKDPDTYAALNWGLLAGFHHYYLGAWIRGTINLLVALTGITLAAVGSPLGFLLLLLVFMIELPALFRSRKICRRYNVKAGQRILDQLSETTGR